MAKRNQQSADGGSESNLLIAVMGLVIAAALAAIMSAWIAGFVLDQLQSTDALVMLVTDGGSQVGLKVLGAEYVRRHPRFEVLPGLGLGFGCRVPWGGSGCPSSDVPQKGFLNQARGVYSASYLVPW